MKKLLPDQIRDVFQGLELWGYLIVKKEDETIFAEPLSASLTTSILALLADTLNWATTVREIKPI